MLHTSFFWTPNIWSNIKSWFLYILGTSQICLLSCILAASTLSKTINLSPMAHCKSVLSPLPQPCPISIYSPHCDGSKMKIWPCLFCSSLFLRQKLSITWSTRLFANWALLTSPPMFLAMLSSHLLFMLHPSTLFPVFLKHHFGEVFLEYPSSQFRLRLLLSTSMVQNHFLSLASCCIEIVCSLACISHRFPSFKRIEALLYQPLFPSTYHIIALHINLFSQWINCNVF